MESLRLSFLFKVYRVCVCLYARSDHSEWEDKWHSLWAFKKTTTATTTATTAIVISANKKENQTKCFPARAFSTVSTCVCSLGCAHIDSIQHTTYTQAHTFQVCKIKWNSDSNKMLGTQIHTTLSSHPNEWNQCFHATEMHKHMLKVRRRRRRRRRRGIKYTHNQLHTVCSVLSSVHVIFNVNFFVFSSKRPMKYKKEENEMKHTHTHASNWRRICHDYYLICGHIVSIYTFMHARFNNLHIVCNGTKNNDDRDSGSGGSNGRETRAYHNWNDQLYGIVCKSVIVTFVAVAWPMLCSMHILQHEAAWNYLSVFQMNEWNEMKNSYEIKRRLIEIRLSCILRRTFSRFSSIKSIPMN